MGPPAGYPPRKWDLGAVDDVVLGDALVELLERDLDPCARGASRDNGAVRRRMRDGGWLRGRAAPRRMPRTPTRRRSRRRASASRRRRPTIFTPPSSKSCAMMRGTIITGVCWRSISSIAGIHELGVVDDRLAAVLVPREVRDHAVERGRDRVEPPGAGAWWHIPSCFGGVSGRPSTSPLTMRARSRSVGGSARLVPAPTRSTR